MEKDTTQVIMEHMENVLPDFIPRKNVKQLTQGMVNPRTLANRDSEGVGVKNAYKVNREVWYFKADFMEYVLRLLSD